MKIKRYFLLGVLFLTTFIVCTASRLNVVETGISIETLRNKIGKETTLISHPDYTLLVYYRTGNKNCNLFKFMNDKLIDQVEVPRWSVNSYIGISPSTPVSATNHYSLACRFQKQKLNHEAFITMRDFISRNPDSIIAYTYLAQLYVNDSLIDSAISVYDNALTRHYPDNAKASLESNYMAFHIRIKKYDRAKELGLNAIMNPNNLLLHGYYYNLACLYSIQNNSDSALLFLSKIIPYVNKGYSKWQVDQDQDFNNIRNNPEFLKIRNQLPELPNNR